jgi:phosphoribosyl 1,2-cyclic phosphodiesterase
MSRNDKKKNTGSHAQPESGSGLPTEPQPQGETPSTPLGKVAVTFWGTRGSISTPGSSTEKYGGNTPCVSLSYGRSSIILDAGTGIRVLGIQLASRIKEEGPRAQHILLSHTHWDHIQGLPFFQPAYMRETDLIIYGSSQKERFLESILRGQMDVNYFPVQMKELAANVSIREFEDRFITIGDIDIEIQEQVLHPGGSIRFRIRAGGKTVIYATDVELNAAFEPAQPTAKTRRLAAEYRAFIKNADLLIADGQYSEPEYDLKKGWGHTSVPLLLKVAHEQGVRQLAVFHHDPEHSDDFFDRMAQQYEPFYRDATPPMQLFWAREGMTVEL